MATIIKHDAPVQPTGTHVRGTAYDLADMASQADRYLDEVRQEATKIIQQAKQEAVKIQQDADRAGRQAALEAVETILDEKVAKQMKSLTPALAEAARQIEDARQKWLRHWESSVVQLACKIAERLIGREMEKHPEITVERIADTLRICATDGAIVVRMNPSDFETLGQQAICLAETIRPAGETKVVADEAISAGGCRIETNFGTVDGQLSAQFERIQQELS